MINNILCIVCKDIVEDSKTRMVSYLNCIEQVAVKKFPAHLPELTLGTTWLKDSDIVETLKVRVKLFFPDGEEKILLETPDNEVKGLRHRVNCVVVGFPLKQAGMYRLVVEKFNKETWEFACVVSFLAVKSDK